MTEDRMTAAEAVMLCRFAKACCPQQQFDEYTPDAWHELLRDLRSADVKEAIVAVAKRQPFVSPAEIRGAIDGVRRERIIRFGYVVPPRELDDDFGAQMRWTRALKQRIGDGELTREQWDAEQAAAGVTGQRNVPELEGVFRRVPNA